MTQISMERKPKNPLSYSITYLETDRTSSVGYLPSTRKNPSKGTGALCLESVGLTGRTRDIEKYNRRSDSYSEIPSPLEKRLTWSVKDVRPVPLPESGHEEGLVWTSVDTDYSPDTWTEKFQCLDMVRPS